MVYLSPGARLSEKLFGATTLHNAKRKEIFYKVTTFLLTYLTYFAYHVAKRPISIMESSKTFLKCETLANVTDSDDVITCDWAWIDEMSGKTQVTILTTLTVLTTLKTLSTQKFRHWSSSLPLKPDGR